MKLLLTILLSFIFIISCNNSKKINNSVTEYKETVERLYELNMPNKTTMKGVLILFGGYSENAQAIRREFSILNLAKKNDIAVLYINFNAKLWLEDDEKIELAELLQNIFKEHKLPKKNVYIGGFSSGGNISLLISNYLVKVNNKIQPKGIFIVDSPIDLLALYQLCEKNIARNYSESSVKEAKWLINLFNSQIGDPKNNLDKYEKKSPYISKTNNIANLSSLENIKIRFYTEPDTTWWKTKRQNDPEDLNAYSITKLTKELKNKYDKKQIELIQTENKGYRSNGVKHPHSWSIVDKNNLINWIIEK